MVENQERNIVSKNIIITGGSRGIGAEIVQSLALCGHNVLLNYNNSEKEALEIQENLKKKNIHIELFKADVSKFEETKKLAEFALNKFKNIDVLINNAGISQTKLFTEITESEWQKMIDTNLSSAFFMSQQIAKNMIKNKKGCIINISSIWGETGASCEVHYSISKAGLDGLTKSLAKELGPSNIRVNSIAPRNNRD